jgi:hypothetical protein
MSEVVPATNAVQGRWLLRPDVHWQDLVRYGPPGFPEYVRIRFDLATHSDQPGEAPGVRRALTTLADYTATPAVAYAAIWEGWAGEGSAPDAPKVPIPNRTMLLFTGPVDVLREAPSRAWRRLGTEHAEPHLVWPEDHVWCLACDVDEDIEFTVGCAEDAARALFEALPGAVRRVDYGAP